MSKASDLAVLMGDAYEDAFEQVVLNGGSQALTANLPFGGFRGTGAGNPVNPEDLATKAYVDSAAGFRSGSWAPVYSSTGVEPSNFSYKPGTVGRDGFWARIGNIVLFSGFFVLDPTPPANGKGAPWTGYLRVRGLPFNASGPFPCNGRVGDCGINIPHAALGYPDTDYVVLEPAMQFADIAHSSSVYVSGIYYTTAP